jgi:hypothetical protein
MYHHSYTIRYSIPPNRQNPTIYKKKITNRHNPDSEKDKGTKPKP